VITDSRARTVNVKRAPGARTGTRATPKPPRPSQPANREGAGWRVARGDCRELLAKLSSGSVDTVVTDPPYGIGFQGEHWDGSDIRRSVARRELKRTGAEAFQAWALEWAGECLRVMRPGAYLAAFGAPRTAHRLACALEDAGFQLRDTLMWLYGSGMPKSRRLPGGQATALKPAYEPILLARKSPEVPIERNVSRHRTGALNAGACRVGPRFPANVLLTHHAACRPRACRIGGCPATIIDRDAQRRGRPGWPPEPPSRIFYCSKAARSERDAGCERLPLRSLDIFPNAHPRDRPARPAANNHPTVKPLELMRWLIRLLAPEGGLVLDPFCGSGSTGAAAVLEGRQFLGIEREAHYVMVAQARITHWARNAYAEDARGP
jgi:DNA modification methylase